MVGVSKMSLPFFLYKSLQKMSNRVKGHIDYSLHSIFHHGLIKLIISTVLQADGKTWDFFLFWSGFQVKQEDQQTKKQADKGKALMRKLGQKVKSEVKGEDKLEEAPEPVKEDNEPKMFPADTKSKYSLFTKKEDQSMQHIIPAEALSEDKAAVTEKVAVYEEDLQAQKRSPINILSDDEGYLLEEDQPISETEVRTDTCRDFSTLENKTVRPRRKKNRVEVMEFAAVKHQGINLRMMGEVAPA